MQFLWKYVDDLVGKGLTFNILAELILYASATFVPLALPLAILLSALMTFGGLGENYELTALKAAGISLTRILYPLVVCIIIISASAFFYSNYSLPFFNWKMRALLYDIQTQRPELQIKEGVYYNGIENYSIKITKKDTKTNLLYGLKIYDHSSNQGNVSVTIADSGYIMMTKDKRTLVITLFNGESYIDMPETHRKFYSPKTYPFRRDKFNKQIINIPLEGLDFQRSEEGLFRTNYQMMNLKQLKIATDSMKRDLIRDAEMLKDGMKSSSYYKNAYRNYSYVDSIAKKHKIQRNTNMKVLYYQMTDNEKISALNSALNEARSAKSSVASEKQIRRAKTVKLRKHEIEWHKKFTLSLACLIFFFIGAPFGAIIRKGGLGLPLVISVLFFVLYYVVTLTGEKMVRESIWPGFMGVWFSSLILFPIGAFLTYKATNDSSFLNMDSYIKFFNKLKENRLFKYFSQGK